MPASRAAGTKAGRKLHEGESLKAERMTKQMQPQTAMRRAVPTAG